MTRAWLTDPSEILRTHISTDVASEHGMHRTAGRAEGRGRGDAMARLRVVPSARFSLKTPSHGVSADGLTEW